MGKIKEVQVKYGRTFNIGSYESIRLDVALTKDILPEENVTEEVSKSMKGLKVIVHQEAARMIREREDSKQSGK